MKLTFLLPVAAIMSLCLVMTSCSRAVTEEVTAPLTEESVTETTAELFDPILISDDYDGPILGIENWHIETGKMSFGGWTICSYHFIEDNTGIEFAYYAGYEDDVTAYLADLDGDGEPELVCNEQTGAFDAMQFHTVIFRLNDGVIERAYYCLGDWDFSVKPEYDYEEETYPLFAEANGITITTKNSEQFTDQYYPDSNRIILTDEGTGKQYELNYDYLVFYPFVTSGEATEVQLESSVDGEIIYTTAEPLVTNVSDTAKKLTFYRDDSELDGMLYLPEGDGPFPVIILCCGFSQPYTDYEAKAQSFADNGYAAVVFDFGCNVDGSTPENGAFDHGEVLLSQVKDLYAVMDNLAALPGVDTSTVFLWGHSYGGFVAAYAGSLRSDEISGLILVEPSIAMNEYLIMQEEPLISVNIFEMLGKIDDDTVIYMGTHDGYGDDPTSFDQVLEVLPSGELVIIEGADHFFEGEYGEMMVKDACEKIASWND